MIFQTQTVLSSALANIDPSSSRNDIASIHPVWPKRRELMRIVSICQMRMILSHPADAYGSKIYVNLWIQSKKSVQHMANVKRPVHEHYWNDLEVKQV
jgi:hypothetical protein